MWYKDIADRLVAAPALAVDADATLDAGSMAVIALKAYQRPCCLCQVLHPHQPHMLVLWRADRDVLVPHRVADIMLASNGSVITAGSRLKTYTCSEIKISFLLDDFWILSLKQSV